MLDNLESLYDLVKWRAVKHNISERKLWGLALTAILDGVLDYGFSDQWIDAAEHPFPCDSETKAPFSREHWEAFVRERIIGALSELQYNTDLIGWGWFQNLMIAPAAFDEWLKEHLSPPPSPPKKRLGRPPVRVRLADFIKNKFPDGVPAGITDKQIARDAKDAIGREVNPRTVARARKLLSDGTK